MHGGCHLLQDRHWATSLTHSLKPSLTVVGDVARPVVASPQGAQARPLTHITTLSSEPMVMPIPKWGDRDSE